MMLVMDIDGVFDRATVSAAGMIRREGTPSDNLVVFHRHRDRMFESMMGEPVFAGFERFGFFLISAGRMEDVMVVNVV